MDAFVLPAFYLPYPGMLAEGLWNERRLAGFDFARCAATIHAEADPGQLSLSTDWLTWGTYADDCYAAMFGARRDVAGARECAGRAAAGNWCGTRCST